MHPERFGKYRIIRKLKGGGMGRVYYATDMETNQTIALKLVDHGTDRDSHEVVEAERRGAILQARLCGLDPRVTVIHEHGDHDGYFYIAMEFIEGEDLSELMARQQIGIPFAARIALDICEVLDHAHNLRAEIDGTQYQGIIHGDVTPRNIRITTTGAVKLLDFGIAKALSMTRKFTQNQYGSFRYSSPERLERGEVDAHSDLWSVGVVLYEMAAGEPYFTAENVTKLEHGIRNYRELRPFPVHLPHGLRRILSRALAPDPSERYATVHEMGAGLREFLAAGLADRAASDDLEVTRRTSRSQGGGDPMEAETRRTSAAALATPTEEEHTRRTMASRPAPVRPAAPKPVSRKPPNPKVRTAKTFIGGFVLMFTTYLMYNEWDAWKDGRVLAHQIESEQLRDTNAAWQQYQELAQRTYIAGTLSSTRDALRRRLLSDADRVIEMYRASDAPAIRQNDWIRCRNAAARGLELMPNDKTVRGKLRLCEGHIERISADNTRQFESARDKFEQASDLITNSPDPYLGLARLYVYNFYDVAKAEEALRQAERRGHEPGKRETSQLADGYRYLGDRLFREAEKSRGMSEEEEFLKRAADAYEHSQELYESVVPFGGAADSLRRVLDNLETIERRRDAIRQAR